MRCLCSLLRALMSGHYQTKPLSAEDITDGIIVNSWTVKHNNDKRVTFSTWDFAGQTVYYNTHQVNFSQLLTAFSITYIIYLVKNIIAIDFG